MISLNRFVKWLGSKVEATGITVFTGFAGSELLFDGNRVTGVRTDDKGVDKEGHQKSNFEPGYDLQAKVVILAEGPRGSLTKQLIQKFDLAKNANPQTYGVGVKELWEVPAGRIAPGEVIYTLGYPLTTKEYGGAWIYGGKDNVVSLGFVTGLDYADPRLDPQRVLQEFKKASVRGEAARGRQDDPLRGEVDAVRRLVGDSAGRGQRMDDPRRLGRLSQFGAAEGNSSRDQERDARGRDRVRRADEK